MYKHIHNLYQNGCEIARMRLYPALAATDWLGAGRLASCQLWISVAGVVHVKRQNNLFRSRSSYFNSPFLPQT